VFREHALRLVRALAERYGDHPAIIAWHISNELAATTSTTTPTTPPGPSVWLRRRYGTLDALNDAWGTAFWSQHYTEWDQILPPRTAPTHRNPGQRLDFERFSSDAVRDHLRAEAAVLAEVTPDIPFTTNFMVAQNVRDIDYPRGPGMSTSSPTTTTCGLARSAVMTSPSGRTSPATSPRGGPGS
jgi:beta-galactosidase